MQVFNFEDIVDEIVAKDPRFPRGAYLFVREALDFTQKSVRKVAKDETRHVTGQELLAGIREFGLNQFGPMAYDVFAEWGIHRTEDFGDIVFHMVDIGLLSKTEDDSQDHFKGGYDFMQVFRRPFLPDRKVPVEHPQPEKN